MPLRIDVDNTGADEASVSAALDRAQQTRFEAKSERTKSSAARTDETVAGANRQDREAMGEPAWDSAERRQQLGRKSRRQGDREAVNSRLLANTHQGTHPAAAVAQKPSLAETSKMAMQGGKGKNDGTRQSGTVAAQTRPGQAVVGRSRHPFTGLRVTL